MIMLDRLTLDQLRTLIAVAEDGSFSAAARRLGRVQSAISQSMQSLEAVLGVSLFDRARKTPVLSEAGRAVLQEARQVVRGAERLRARAESIASDVEPELTLAVDGTFPSAPVIASLKSLSETFPLLPVTLFTEHLGGAQQRLNEGTARLAIYPIIEGTIGRTELEVEFLVGIPFIPVAAAGHPLAAEAGPLDREALLPHVQLVVTDRTRLTEGLSGGVLGSRIWRFADLSTRLDYLLAGFGWCNMPLHMIEGHLASGRLKRLDLKAFPGPVLVPQYIVHEPGRQPGLAGRWLIKELRNRLAETESASAA
jgi:DNA-binding transcriptional LysR family regulator